MPNPSARSALTCQKVTPGIHTISSRTSRPGGSCSQSGSCNRRSGLHQVIGSEGCCRYRTRVSDQGGTLGGDVVARTVAEADGAAALVGRLHFRAARVPLVDKVPVHRIEARGANEERSIRAVRKIVLATEGGFTAERAQALTEHRQLGSAALGQPTRAAGVR